YYLELQDHGHPDSPTAWGVQTAVNEGLEKISEELDIPCVVTSDGHYLSHEDRDTHEILLCVGTGAFLSDENRMSLKELELHVTDPCDMIKRWSQTAPAATKYSKRTADRCSRDIELRKVLIPKSPVPGGEAEKTSLAEPVYRGLAVRYLSMGKEAADEMSVE